MLRFPTRAALPLMLLLMLLCAGCAPPAPPPPEAPLPGVTANSGGDTRGTVLYRPGPLPAATFNPYAAVSDVFVIGQRQEMARALAEIDAQAHAQAARRYPVSPPGTPRYSKPFASVRAQRQAQLNVTLLEKYHAHFCNQYHVTSGQMILIIQEAREKHWSLPPPLSPPRGANGP